MVYTKYFDPKNYYYYYCRHLILFTAVNDICIERINHNHNQFWIKKS